jgi:hypothetical protein
MKGLIVFALFLCPVFMVFSQDPNVSKFRELSDSMGTTVSKSNSTLGNFDLRMANNDHFNTYTSYKIQHDSLVKALRESEARLNKLISSNAPETTRKEERDKYERLTKKLETVKSDYDKWLQSVQ